eukprot:SAG25_NODE_6649_length_541_cov_1.153846_1_plen_27_part_01
MILSIYLTKYAACNVHRENSQRWVWWV